MLNVEGDVSEEAFMLWGFGCLMNGQYGGPIAEQSLPMAPRILRRRSGLWANASSNMCFEVMVTAAMDASVVESGK